MYEKDPVSGRARWVSGGDRRRSAPTPMAKSNANPLAPTAPQGAAPGGVGSALGGMLATSFGGREVRSGDVGWDSARAGVSVVGGVASAINPTIGSVVTEAGGAVTTFLQSLFGR